LSASQNTRKLHEDLRVHVLEQMTEIEGLRQNAENSQKAIKHLETRLQGMNSELDLYFAIIFHDA
jgi:predicted  nucleic acid-binding Zn-ribbon protein